MQPVKRIGILTCANASRTLGCCSASCKTDFKNRDGMFKSYPKDQEVELISIASCPGCPTDVAPGGLLREVRALAKTAQIIHFSSCIVALCPFKEKLMEPLKNKFPAIVFIAGTHGTMTAGDEFWEKVKDFAVPLPARSSHKPSSGRPPAGSGGFPVAGSQ
jgi:predicted metal-binding protein